MTKRTTGPAHKIPLSTFPSSPEPMSSNSRVSTPQQNGGSSHNLNGSTVATPSDDALYSHAHTGFCYRWPPPGHNKTDNEHTVDIVAVPAVGGHPMSTWYLPPKDYHLTQVKSVESVNGFSTPTAIEEALRSIGMKSTIHSVPSNSFGLPWILHDLPLKIKAARILVYSHGKPQERATIDQLSTSLLENICDERKSEGDRKKPLFFISHSTGGLVVKAALIKAQGDSLYGSISDNCYGVAFFATPHQGSSYLSSPTYSDTIVRAMGLQWPMPLSLQKQLKIKSEILVQMAQEWMPVAAELNIWTFYETIDTDLTDGKAHENDRVSFQAPITSIKSAILELHHEVDRPLQANHADCAAFGHDNEYTKRSFIKKLFAAASQAESLSLAKHVNIGLENKIEVEVHGFYGSTDQATADKNQTPPIRLWSTSNRLDTFLKIGPAECLKNRLQEKTVPPTRTQMLNSASSRRTSFRVESNTKPGSPVAINHNLTENQPSGSSTRLVQGILVRSKDTTGRRFSSPSISPTSKSQIPSASVPVPSAVVETGRPIPRMPSFLVSEHGEDTSSPLSSPPLTRNEPSYFTDALPSLELKSQPINDLSGTSRTSGTSRENLPKQSTNSLSNQNERLSPLSVQPRANKQPTLAPPTDQDDSDDSDTESNGGEAPSAGPPVRPEPGSQKFVWIHLPFNNPKWVSDILSTLSKERGNKMNDVLLHENVWRKRHIRGRNTHYHACFVKPGCILINPHLRPSDPPMTAPSPPANIMMSLYLPYLHWDTYRRMVKRRDIVKKRLIQGRFRPTPENIGTMDLELIVAWKYLGYDPPFHTRRTLDQFGYPNLSDTRARDDDQMLYKMTKQWKHPLQEKEEQNTDTSSNVKSQNDSSRKNCDATKPNLSKDPYKALKDGKVLMVDQVWMWIADSATLVTFFPQRQPVALEGKLYQQADLRNSIYNEVNADLSRRCENSLDLAALVALHSVTLLFERATHRDLEIFRIFEAAISILVERLTESFKYFRAKGFQAVADDDDSDDDADTIREHHKEEGRKFQSQVRKNVSALLELRDISDELLTLKKLFDQQQEGITDMLHNYERCGYSKINGVGFLQEAQHKLKDYLHRIQEMTESAERTRDDFVKLLDLVQRQANVDESRRSRWQVDLQTFQSRAIFIFTVFTIFFLPLSFFTGIFGMNTSQWAGTNGTPVSLQKIAETSLPVSFAIFGGALTLALSTPIWRRVKFAVKFLFNPFETIERETFDSTDPNAVSVKKKAERHWRKFKKVKKTEDYHERDFWEANQEGTGDKYEIPAHNRQAGEQRSDKEGSWKSSHKSWSWGKAGKRSQDRTSNNDLSLAEP